MAETNDLKKCLPSGMAGIVVLALLIISPAVVLGGLVWFWKPIVFTSPCHMIMLSSECEATQQGVSSCECQMVALFPHVVWAAVVLYVLILAGIGMILWYKAKKPSLDADLVSCLKELKEAEIFASGKLNQYDIQMLRIIFGREKPPRKPAKNSDDSDYL